jgi:hypothetical protein
MTSPSIETLKAHHAAIIACRTFEEFREVQAAFVAQLISLIEKDEDALYEAALEVVRARDTGEWKERGEQE